MSNDKVTSVPSPVASEPCCDHEDDGGVVIVKDMSKSESELEAPQGDGTPDIVKTLVYYGLGEGKKPDPKKILFYERPDGSCIDCSSRTTLPTRPSVLDHLPSRPITVEDHDVLAAIVYGAMSGADYQALSENGMISDVASQMWDKVQQLNAMQENMAKSQELAKSEGEEESQEESKEQDETETQKEENQNEEQDSDSDSESSLEDKVEEVGVDVVQQIMDAAVAKAIGGEEGLESTIRRIVNEILSGHSGNESELDDGETQEESSEQSEEGDSFEKEPNDEEKSE